ncbi:hypothetical protein WR25_03853 [Diploscapter pachys]|uniref:Haloacid dehalogenase-like hydrolase domain-containing protein 2 n=1 Tax=Diploscapter pachys TaxID=2018661 RepID=A0A2A2JMM1_9BILA|nr:hypothetical protein WR25_03853 [Diploscapter pachys]
MRGSIRPISEAVELAGSIRDDSRQSKYAKTRLLQLQPGRDGSNFTNCTEGRTINQPVVYISKYSYSKRDKMNYLDDMIELVEDLPEEFQKRFSEIRRLDELVEEMGKECKVMAEELFNSPTTTKERKEQLILELADKRRAMHLLAERKVSIAERSERLMLKIFEKVQESAYHCKIELEVDNPGISERIEQRFCQTLDLRPSNSRLYDGILEFESIHNGNDSDSETVSIASEAASVASTSRSILKERTNKSRDNFLSAANKNKKHKKKDKKKKKNTDLSYYMRKKQKLMQDEASGRKMTAGDAMPSSLGMKLDGNGIIYEGESDDGDEGTGQRQKKELMTDTNSALGSERGADEQDDLEDLDVFNLFPNNLPSPPREIMESLKEEMPFDVDGSDSGFMPGHSSHSSSSLSALGQFPLRRAGGGDFYSDFNGDFAPDSPRLAKLQLPQMNSASRKNNTKLSFGNVNDTSFHGRVRKLTDKAVESMEFHEREKGGAASINRKKDEWCLCRESIEDDMILCDNKKIIRKMARGIITAAFVDLSGTLHIGDEAVSGAVEALEKLRKLAEICFVTNTTKESKNNLHNRLRKAGFKIDKSEIFSSLSAARKLIDEKKYRPMLFLEEEALEDFRDVDTSSPNAVVVGLAPSQFHYDRMNDAFRLLLEEGTELIAIHKGKYYRREDGLSLGPGPFICGLEYATGKKATVVGKPEKTFFELALQTFNKPVDMSNVVMIGKFLFF